jgi:hypothetical protein
MSAWWSKRERSRLREPSHVQQLYMHTSCDAGHSAGVPAAGSWVQLTASGMAAATSTPQVVETPAIPAGAETGAPRVGRSEGHAGGEAAAEATRLREVSIGADGEADFGEDFGEHGTADDYLDFDTDMDADDDDDGEDAENGEAEDDDDNDYFGGMMPYDDYDMEGQKTRPMAARSDGGDGGDGGIYD